MNGSTTNNAPKPNDTVVFPLDDLKPQDYAEDQAYTHLTQNGVDPLVAAECCEMIRTGIFRFEDLDERLLEFSKNQKPEHARFVLNQFRKSNLMGVLNPVQYLGSMLRNFKERVKLLGSEVALSTPIYFAPKAESLQALLDRTNYPVEITVGQRRYGPPPKHDGPAPGQGCEIYIGKIPNDMYEDELVPILEKYGTLYDFRLMMDPVSGQSKGYGFAMFMQKSEAQAAVKNLEDYEVKPGKKLRCNVSIANTRLFIGNIPKSKSKEEIMNELSTVAEIEGIVDVIIYADAEDPVNKRNCGYCFVEFSDHKTASAAKRRLVDGYAQPWNLNVVTNWAEPQEEPSEEVMAQVRTLFVKNLRDVADEETVRKAFSVFGEVFKVRRMKDYAFVYFNERDHAMAALDKMNGKDFMGSTIDVSLAKPQSEARKKIIQNRMRESQHQQMMSGAQYYQGYGGQGYYSSPYAASPGSYMPYPGYGYGTGGGYGMAPARPMGMPMAGRGGPIRARASPTMAAQYRMGAGAPVAAAGGYNMSPRMMGTPRGGGMPNQMKRPFNEGGGYVSGVAAKRGRGGGNYY